MLGGLDQTSATIGLAISYIKNSADLVEQLRNIQRDFLAIGATLAAEKPDSMPILEQLPQKTKKFEDQIDQWDAQLPALTNFILAGGASGGATLHLARTIIRQTERHYHRLYEDQKIEEIGIYLNRMSDYLFQAARFYNYSQKQPEDIWKISEN